MSHYFVEHNMSLILSRQQPFAKEYSKTAREGPQNSNLRLILPQLAYIGV